MRARMLGVRGRVVQNGIGEAHLFLLTRHRGRSLMDRLKKNCFAFPGCIVNLGVFFVRVFSGPIRTLNKVKLVILWSQNFHSTKWPTVFLCDENGKLCNFEACLCGSLYSSFKLSI